MSHILYIIVPLAVQSEMGDILEDFFIAYFGGYSRYIISGGWISSIRKVVKEDSWMYFVLTGMAEKNIRSHAQDIVDTIKGRTYEEEVLWWFQPITR